MRSIISRWFMFGLLLGWAISHATVFAQGGAAQPASKGDGQPVDKLRQGLDKSVNLNYTGQSLQDVLNHFRERTGLAINVDQLALMQMGLNGEIALPQVELRAKNEKASSVLRKLLNNHRLTYIILDDAVLVTTEETALVRQMRQRVSVDVEEVPFQKAVRELAKKHGLNLVIDPLVKQTADTPVSLQLDNTGIETALRLLAEMAHLKAVRMGNVMFITTETKAKLIREEEQHQFDNPLNPNVPGGVPPIAVGGFNIGGLMRGGGVPGVAVPEGFAPVPVPPPGIELPKAVPQPGANPVAAPAKKVIDLRNPAAPPPPIPGTVDSPPLPRAVPLQRNPNER